MFSDRSVANSKLCSNILSAGILRLLQSLLGSLAEVILVRYSIGNDGVLTSAYMLYKTWFHGSPAFIILRQVSENDGVVQYDTSRL